VGSLKKVTVKITADAKWAQDITSSREGHEEKRAGSFQDPGG
jgi:hypothetical protein